MYSTEIQELCLCHVTTFWNNGSKLTNNVGYRFCRHECDHDLMMLWGALLWHRKLRGLGLECEEGQQDIWFQTTPYLLQRGSSLSAQGRSHYYQMPKKAANFSSQREAVSANLQPRLTQDTCSYSQAQSTYLWDKLLTSTPSISKRWILLLVFLIR